MKKKFIAPALREEKYLTQLTLRQGTSGDFLNLKKIDI